MQQAKLISRLSAGQLVNGVESKQAAESWMSSSAGRIQRTSTLILEVGPAEEMLDQTRGVITNHRGPTGVHGVVVAEGKMWHAALRSARRA